jgi:hypothetical protein
LWQPRPRCTRLSFSCNAPTFCLAASEGWTHTTYTVASEPATTARLRLVRHPARVAEVAAVEVHDPDLRVVVVPREHGVHVALQHFYRVRGIRVRSVAWRCGIDLIPVVPLVKPVTGIDSGRSEFLLMQGFTATLIPRENYGPSVDMGGSYRGFRGS